MGAIIDRFCTNTAATRMEDSSFEVTVKVVAVHVFYSWVFGFGGLAEPDGAIKVCIYGGICHSRPELRTRTG